MNIQAWAKKNKLEATPEQEASKVEKAGIFDLISYLTDRKKSWEELSETEKKAFAPYMINKILAMNPLFNTLVSDMQKYTMGQMPTETIYYLYHKVLPAKKFYTKFIKSKKEEKYGEELITIIANHFQESKKNAISYLDLIDATELRSILEMYGKSEKEIDSILNKTGSKTKTKKKK